MSKLLSPETALAPASACLLIEACPFAAGCAYRNSGLADPWVSASTAASGLSPSYRIR